MEESSTGKQQRTDGEDGATRVKIPVTSRRLVADWLPTSHRLVADRFYLIANMSQCLRRPVAD